MSRLTRALTYIIFMTIILQSCVGKEDDHNQQGSFESSGRSLSYETIDDPELYAKWLFAHFAQNEWYFLLDLPRKGVMRIGEGMDPAEIEQKKYVNVRVPVEDLIPHISVLSTELINENIIRYNLKLDEDGQTMICESRGDDMREMHAKFISVPHHVDLEIQNGQFIIIEP